MRADAARNRDRVLRAAREAVAEGDLSLQLNEIARRAGVGVGTVYRHFPTRRALLETLVDDRFRDLLEQARAAEAEEDPGAGVERLLRAVITALLAGPDLAEVLTAAEDARPQTARMRAELESAAERVIRRAVHARAIRPGLTAADVMHLVCGVVFAARLGPDTPTAQAERYLPVLLTGLRAVPAP